MADTGQGILKNPKMLALFGVLGLLAILIGWRVMSGGRNAVPPPSPALLTRDRLLRLTAAVSTFVAKEQRLPGTLDEGAGIENVQDGWKHPFTMTPGTEGGKKTSFVIRSAGADGTMENEDDQYSKVKFGNDGYGNLGVESTVFVPAEVTEPG